MTDTDIDIDLENEKRLYAAFILYGVTQVEVNFDGSGDSGCIEYVNIEGPDEKTQDAAVITIYVYKGTVFNPETKQWEKRPHQETQVSLKDAIEAIVYDQLNESNVDWYNNDGGFGSWTWDSKNGVEFHIDVRQTVSETVHSVQRQLGETE